jgi:acetyl esterase/lipase
MGGCMKNSAFTVEGATAGTQTGRESGHAATRLAAAIVALGMAAPLAPAIELREFIALPRPAPAHQVRYGAATSQAIDVFLPSGSGPHPVAIVIHGGCWADLPGANREQLRPLAAEWARRGVAVWSIGYRRANEQGGGYPSMYRDVAGAIDKLRVKSVRLGIDLRRSVLVGHSAGGHLALWAAARPSIAFDSPLSQHTDPLPIAHVVSVAGIGDLAAFAPRIPDTCGPGVRERLTGHGSDPFGDVSPARLALPGSIRSVVMVSGTADMLVPLHAARDYLRALSPQDAARVRLRDVAGAGHFDLVVPGTMASETVFEEVSRAVGLSTPTGMPEEAP